MTSTIPRFDAAVGSLVRARGREWVVLPGSTPEFLLLQPLGGGSSEVAGVFPDEGVEIATFPPPTTADLGDSAATDLLRTALRVGFTAGAGPFRSLAGISVTPRSYQYVPLLMALRQDTTRLLIADDVGIGKTIEAGLVAAELLAQGTVQRLAVLCSPALAGQWREELSQKFGIDAELLLTSTVKKLERGLMLNESVFDRHPHLVVSTDFIKSDRRRHEFLLRCPELVIVDEAHNSVAGGGAGQRGRHQRYELLRGLADDPGRHLVLATATPHSGDETAFANLVGLLHPDLATADLSREAGRRLLAQHFVQRRRADIRHFLDEDTPFPKDRQTLDLPYELSPAYRDLFDDVLAWAREQVRDGVDGTRQRVRWWSVLALLRSLASSPRAASASLRTRAAGLEAATAQEADALGRAAVLDAGDDEQLEGIDATPGARSDLDDEEGAAPEGRKAERRERARLLDFARRAERLGGPEEDRKLRMLERQLRGLLKEGYAPIVFCRFIDTAHYVTDHLQTVLGSARTPVNVIAVTGELPPAERERRIEQLTALDGAHVLVATDCLSEGVNLQQHFSAVVHYDLCWNPTRHEQREGRVDRYLQPKAVVRAVTLYGEDNGIDGIVLDVLIRRHRAIAKATGVAVPIPGDGQGVIDALAEGLLLRGEDSRDLTLDLGLDERTRALEDAWSSAAEQERRSRTRYAQHAIKPEEVAVEVEEMRRSLGSPGDLHRFVTGTLRSLGSTVTPVDGGITATTSTLPMGARSSLPVGLREPVPFRADPPTPRGGAVIARTDPAVRALGRHVLESALDPTVPAAERPARRAGVMVTGDVTTRTTLLLLRLRFQLTLPAGEATLQRVAEDARVLAFQGAPDQAVWLPDEEAERLLDATPTGNLPEQAARHMLSRILEGLPSLTGHLDGVADEHASRLLASHRRVRAGAGAARRGLAVTAQHPVDLLSVQVLQPAQGGAA